MIKKNNKLPFLLLGTFIVFALTQSAYAQEISISSGHQLLQNKEYEAAFDTYLSLIENDEEGVSLFYNTGIAAYELGRYPEAILYFEKALELEAKNKAILHNLDLSYKKTNQDFIQVEAFFMTRWWQSFYLLLGPLTWTIVLLILILASVGSFYFYQFGKTILETKTGMRLFFPLLLLVVVVFMAAKSRNDHIVTNKYAILMDASALFNGPDQRSEKLYDLNAGSKILILDELEGWLKVELINKERGWVEEGNLERI